MAEECMMIMFVPYCLLLTVIFARISATYDSRSSRGKHIVVKNDFFAKILIEKDIFRDRGKRTLKKDRNKMSVAGLVFYLCNLFIVVLTVAFMFLPQMPCKPFEIDTIKMYCYADTINTKIPIILTMILLCAEIFYLTIKLSSSEKTVEQKWIKALILVFSIVVWVVCGATIILMVVELFKW